MFNIILTQGLVGSDLWVCNCVLLAIDAWIPRGPDMPNVLQPPGAEVEPVFPQKHAHAVARHVDMIIQHVHPILQSTD